MDTYGFWSLCPPLVAIILAIKTRQVFISLLFGIWMGWVILSGGNFFYGTINTIQALVDVSPTDCEVADCSVPVCVLQSSSSNPFIKVNSYS